MRSLLDAVEPERAVLTLLTLRATTAQALTVTCVALERAMAEAMVAEYELEQAIHRAEKCRRLLHEASDAVEQATTEVAIVRDTLADYTLRFRRTVTPKSA